MIRSEKEYQKAVNRIEEQKVSWKLDYVKEYYQTEWCLVGFDSLYTA